MLGTELGSVGNRYPRRHRHRVRHTDLVGPTDRQTFTVKCDGHDNMGSQRSFREKKVMYERHEISFSRGREKVM